MSEPYFRPNGLGPDCSTPRSARLRQRRFDMGYAKRPEPPPYTALAAAARDILLEHEAADPALARALALRHVVEHCEITLEPDTLLVGGEEPFFFNLLLPALQADRHSRQGQRAPTETAERLRRENVFNAACFEGHITPGLEQIMGLGLAGLRGRIEGQVESAVGEESRRFYDAARLSLESLAIYAERHRQAALARAGAAEEPWAGELRTAAAVLARVPERPAESLHEALQAYWLAYCLVTLEMGGCCPGGGLGLGRLDQSLYPYYRTDVAAGRLNRAAALELLELFLLGFRHVDYHTPHQPFTPGSQASLGGVTPAGGDASNELTELVMEASTRIAMPAPYLSVRLHRRAPARYWQAAANYVAGGLGFPIVNDEVLIPAFLRHGRSLADARDYICSCCYENTIPGREAFHPNAAYLNLPAVLERSLPQTAEDFGAVLTAFQRELDCVVEELVGLVDRADRSHMANRRYPLMSTLMDDCLAKGQDVCAGGARYNPTGCIVAGLPDVVNSLAAVRWCVFERGTVGWEELRAALAADFEGFAGVRRHLLAAPKWGNGEQRVDTLAATVTGWLYEGLAHRRNPRGGRWQLALYSFVANHHLGKAVGALPDGRRAGEPLTRNLNPAWGTDRQGPTAVLESLSQIDFTQAPNGSSLDLRFDPAVCRTAAGREKLAGFLRAFVELGVSTMQITMVDTETLLAAQAHPEQHPHLMVKVAGYSARFVDLPPEEQAEIIGRSLQSV